MLCQFIVKNYKSIRDEVILDMQATAISEQKETLILDRDGEKFLPVAAIYGPNGAGKSNVLEALYALSNKIMKPICSVCDEDCVGKNRKSSIIPFLFNSENRNMPTEFTVFFRKGRSEYRYILYCRKENIIYESLDKKNIEGKRYLSLYERKGRKVEYRGSFKRMPVPQNISDNVSLLSYLAITNKRNETIYDIIAWFEHGLNFSNYANPFTEATVAIPKTEKAQEFVIKMLQEMDIDISGFRIEGDKNDDNNEDDKEAFSKHLIKGREYELPISEESAGTQKIMGFLPDVINCLLAGAVLCVDELDSKLHPMLIKYIIGLFTNKEINKKGAQLIFTSHDLANMNNKVFRRDEIWFVARNNSLSTELYSLVEIKDSEGIGIRKDSRYDKQYMEGKYGADPYLRKIIDWGDVCN